MCGIAAIIADDSVPIPDGAIERMVASLAHRGPDCSTSVRLPGCHLGHTRLSVIDLAGGAQPMSDPAQRYDVVFNGEIYNFRELRRELEGRSVAFRTQSDTEVLLLGYREFGESVVERLNGQFAFAIWDRQTRRLFAARDRLGEKPLFWAKSPAGQLLIASEIRAILAAGLVVPELDSTSVDAFLTLLYVPPDRTIYSNIETLRPGHAMLWERGRRCEWAYWQPRLSTHSVDAVEAVRHVRQLLERAVQRQMVADVPVGAFLSGGLDSSTIVALMSRHTTSPIKTLSVGFADLINELPFAKAVAEAYRTEHIELQMEIPVAEYLERMAEVYDEPFGDSSNIPTYLISEFARRQVKVVLAGDGGDELFGGYSWYEPLLLQAHLPTSAAAFFQARWQAKLAGVLQRLGAPVGGWRAQAAAAYKGIRAKRRFPDLWQRHLAALRVDAPPSRRQLWQRTQTLSAEDALAQRYEPPPDVQGIDRAVDFDLRCYLAGDIFVKVDRAAMAHGLETRSPFMDVDLVEFVLSLPSHVRFDGGQLKCLLRRSCEDLWPASVRTRSKQGFGAPLQAWLQQPNVASLARRVFRPGTPLTGLLPGAAQAFRKARRNPQSIWNLLCLGLWLEKHPTCLQRLSSVA
jgi:asparagine synthase (glutamine-hydrolysing)